MHATHPSRKGVEQLVYPMRLRGLRLPRMKYSVVFLSWRIAMEVGNERGVCFTRVENVFNRYRQRLKRFPGPFQTANGINAEIDAIVHGTGAPLWRLS